MRSASLRLPRRRRWRVSSARIRSPGIGSCNRPSCRIEHAWLSRQYEESTAPNMGSEPYGIWMLPRPGMRGMIRGTMPSKPKSACLHPGCPAKVVGGRCENHSRRRTPRSGDSIYGCSQWRRLRVQILAETPWCSVVGCCSPGTDVDHVVPISRGCNPFDVGNLQVLCKACHSRKTVLENGGFGRV